MADPILIGSEIKAVPGIDNAKQVFLFSDTDTTSPKSLFDSATGSVYQVPVGRKLIILFARMAYANTSDNSRTEYRVWESAAVNTASGTEKLFGNSTSFNPETIIETYMQFAASQYVTRTTSSAMNCDMRGIEIDA